MRIESIDQVVSSDIHSRLLRFLLAASEGIDEEYLTSEERQAATEMVAMGLVRRDGGRLEANLANPEVVKLMESYGVVPSAVLSDFAKRDPAEFERLYAEHREMIQLVGFIQDLTSTIIKAGSIADVFHSAFTHLSTTVSFDVAVGVILEQNIDVYLSRRTLRRVDDPRLIARIRETLQKQMTVSFVSTDVIIRADLSDGVSEGVADPLAFENYVTLKQDERTAGTLILYRGDSEFRFEDNRYLEILSTQVSMVLGTIRAQMKIQSLADTDDLTGVWNKRHLKRNLGIEVERARTYGVPLSLLMFDVDDFKRINDRYGHPMGDVVLSELCGIVRETLRPPDFFARYGGDEFVIVLPHTDLAGARAAGDRILQKVRALDIMPPDDASKIKPSISMGIATYVPPDMTANDLIELADQRLYDSKKSGKNRYSW